MSQAKQDVLVVKRSRRKSVEAGSLKSARESLERAQNRKELTEYERKKMAVRLRDTIAARTCSLSNMLDFFARQSTRISRSEFHQAVLALGAIAPTEIIDTVFDEADSLHSGLVDKDLYLCFSLHDALSRSAALVLDFLRKKQLQMEETLTLDTGLLGEAIRVLGWEVPPFDALCGLLESIDGMHGSGSCTLKRLTNQLAPRLALRRFHDASARALSAQAAFEADARGKTRYPLRRGSLDEQFEKTLKENLLQQPTTLPAIAHAAPADGSGPVRRGSVSSTHARRRRSSFSMPDGSVGLPRLPVARAPPAHLLHLLHDSSSNSAAQPRSSTYHSPRKVESAHAGNDGANRALPPSETHEKASTASSMLPTPRRTQQLRGASGRDSERDNCSEAVGRSPRPRRVAAEGFVVRDPFAKRSIHDEKCASASESAAWHHGPLHYARTRTKCLPLAGPQWKMPCEVMDIDTGEPLYTLSPSQRRGEPLR